ncbi:MAG: hypothetical protein CM15mP12_9260 [Gammaproteobacteria bacterium]|nr:MAG: hypothetical protein CM15mP12_9260 [Gammaproteobacteria bacterium]
MQRTLNEAGPAGPVQYIKNTGDATIRGFPEADVVLLLQNDFVFNASLGTLDAGYDEVVYDISQDGVVDSVDLNLMLPRAADSNLFTWIIKGFHGCKLVSKCKSCIFL